jgi:hypothetical protein
LDVATVLVALFVLERMHAAYRAAPPVSAAVQGVL